MDANVKVLHKLQYWENEGAGERVVLPGQQELGLLPLLSLGLFFFCWFDLSAHV